MALSDAKMSSSDENITWVYCHWMLLYIISRIKFQNLLQWHSEQLHKLAHGLAKNAFGSSMETTLFLSSAGKGFNLLHLFA